MPLAEAPWAADEEEPHPFAIDYYQREYRWETKQVAELLEDLAEKFLESHEAGNERSAVEQYGHYFLGSIIMSDKNGQKFIIDGIADAPSAPSRCGKGCGKRGQQVRSWLQCRWRARRRPSEGRRHGSAFAVS